MDSQTGRICGLIQTMLLSSYSEDDEDEAAVDDDEHLFAPRFSRFGSSAKRRRATKGEVESSGEASGDE